MAEAALKLPRIALRKVREGSPGDLRAAQTTMGDSLRRWGAVRVEAGAETADPSEAVPLALDLLVVLEGYFGLAPGSLSGRFAPQWSGAASVPRGSVTDAGADLLLLVRDPGQAIVLAHGGEGPRRVGLRPGEVLAATGPALALLSADALPSASLSVDGPEPVAVFHVRPQAGRPLAVLPEFLAAGRPEPTAAAPLPEALEPASYGAAGAAALTGGDV